MNSNWERKKGKQYKKERQRMRVWVRVRMGGCDRVSREATDFTLNLTESTNSVGASVFRGVEKTRNQRFYSVRIEWYSLDHARKIVSSARCYWKMNSTKILIVFWQTLKKILLHWIIYLFQSSSIADRNQSFWESDKKASIFSVVDCSSQEA